MGRNLTRWLIPLPAILFAVIPQNANAEPVAGLNAVGYVVTEIPPTKSDTVYQTCGSELENNINRNFNGEPFQQCPVDLFMVHYTGFITVPENDTIKFMIAADDGGTIQIGNTEFGTWNTKGCSWSAITTAAFPAATYALDGWFYEAGGSTCFMLVWNINNTGWAIVPDSAFTTNGVSQTTSTTSSTTTSSSTTTTLPTTTTTTTSTTTTSTTTTLPEITTTTSSTTSSTTTLPITTTTVQSTTTTQTTTTTSTTTIPIYTTTTTIQTFITEPEKVVVPETTAPETFIPEPDEVIVPDTTEPETFIPDPDGPVEEPVVPVETTILETFFPDYEDGPVLDVEEEPLPITELLEETIISTTLEEVDDSLVTTIVEEIDVVLEEVIEDEPVTDKQVEQILETLSKAAPEQIVEAITQVLAADITSDQATEIASSPEVLAAITETQAEELFEQIVVDELSEEQLEAFTEVIQEAPTEIKQAFEKTIDIFSSKFDDYVPTGSNVPVRTRRTLVVIGSLLTMLPSVHIKTGKS